MTDITCLCDDIRCRPITDSPVERAKIELLCCIAQGLNGGPTTTSNLEVEIVCASTDSRLILLSVDNVTGTINLTELDGSPVVDGATAISCDSDYKTVESCFQDITDNTIQFTRLVCFQSNNPSSTRTLWLDATGSVVAPPANVEPCSQIDFSEIRHVCLCDDINGDGSNIVEYVEAFKIQCINGIIESTSLGFYEDDTYITPYTPVNPGVCGMIGSPARICQERVVLENGATFTVTSDITSYTVKVITGNSSTFTSTSGSVTNLFQGESFTHAREGGILLQSGAIVTGAAGDTVVVDYDILCT